MKAALRRPSCGERLTDRLYQLDITQSLYGAVYRALTHLIFADRLYLEAKLMKDPFFAIRLIRRYGSVGVIALALAVTVGISWGLWGTISWFAFPLAATIGALTFIIARSYIELLSMIFERLS